MREVRRLRQEKGWNQTELAFYAGLAPSVISEIETGKRNPSAGTLHKLAEALDVDVPDLFERTQDLKAQAPLPFEEGPQRRIAAEDEAIRAQREAYRYLRAWRSYIDYLARRWEVAGREPTAEQVRDVLGALEQLIAAGVFDISKVHNEADRFEVDMLWKGVDRLRGAAEKAVAAEEAEQLRRTFTVIDGQRAAS